MSLKTLPKYPRILAVAPLTRGFGFAVMEGQRTLVNWGVKSVTGEKNAQCVHKVEKMILHYQPDILVFEDFAAKDSRRNSRIKALGKQLVALTRTHGIKSVTFSSRQIRSAFFAEGAGTKHAIAEVLAGRFPDELASRLPPKRRAWESEDYRMGIFDAVALAVLPCYDNRKRQAGH